MESIPHVQCAMQIYPLHTSGTSNHPLCDSMPSFKIDIVPCQGPETLSKLKLLQVTKCLDLDLAWNDVNLK